METDNGKTWIIWKCQLSVEMKNEELWMILSRSPTLESKLEDVLVQSITKKNHRIGYAELKGISHSDCHDRL